MFHRLDAKNGALAWMPDGRSFCYGQIRERYSSSRCGRLTYDCPYGPIDREADICRSDRAVCFPSADMPR
ncbi:hypothetical protein ABZ135_10670 [Streptomyces sp. NPDC006339]|uniref:hypothetical protein n=1 Tax=Streptomyces sp. NPDC006339 TaxID=3156755 RepID=UPI0033B3541A